MARDQADDRQDPHAGRVRERDARAARHRRLDQRHRPPHGDRRPPGLRDRPARASTAWAARRRCCSISSPPGQHYMEDFHKAGGMPTLLRELKPLLHLDALTVTGRTLGRGDRARRGRASRRTSCRRSPTRSIRRAASRCCAATSRRAARSSSSRRPTPKLMEHEGRAVVFENAEDLVERIDADALDVTAHDILVLKNIGPKGAPGMPEAGYLPIPRKLARAGVKDMVRISDGRMSGTAVGTIVLHVTPEAAIGGPARPGAQRRPHPPQRRRARTHAAGVRRGAGAAGARKPRRRAGRRARLPQALPADRDAGRPGGSTLIFSAANREMDTHLWRTPRARQPDQALRRGALRRRHQRSRWRKASSSACSGRRAAARRRRCG